MAAHIDNQLAQDKARETKVGSVASTVSSKADPGTAHWARATPFEKLVGFVFVKFDCI